ncbi:hypothetical protein DFP72DRAFT_805897 [Ephemerocybe angulata]|uniref:Uncharacterized protein n=1 Tax=Ephemerocybe angulata TaxID=980116 RepID=A0A8H6I697_9AGAR|nr:hypothetical protein DFP72DRAFT_805897 [Tulosesus angulatus]
MTSSQEALECKKVTRKRVDVILRLFGFEPKALLDAMETHGAIISGSAALAALFPLSFMPGDIDFYAGQHKTDSFCQWLIANTRYRLVKPSAPAAQSEVEGSYSLACRSIGKVLTLQDGQLGMKINVVETISSEPFAAVFSFYTTLVMNVITHAGVGCAYPDLTAERIGVRTRSNSPARILLEGRIRTMNSRGFTVEMGWDSQAVQAIIRGHACGEGRSCHVGERQARSNRGLLWMTFEEKRGAEMESFIPNVSWRLPQEKSCNDFAN